MNLNLLNNNSSPNQIFNNVVNNPNISIDDFRAMTLAVNNKTPLNSFFTNTGNERTKEGIHSEIKKSNQKTQMLPNMLFKAIPTLIGVMQTFNEKKKL